ncbi:MAG: hypothetical protein KBG48_22950 [Kofleriaceae bacterium]|jgi:hypothetical protein|nr:hypothetical protein [Kofleriaceae bacterium]MBP9170282.1 hypothetical protein [Kofleriaceae bacterium]MBP9861528.1 hypothetical protein [Kofleriaceae bacterium]
MTSEDKHHQVGLSRRKLEDELRWMLRHPPADSAALIKLLGQVIVTLIDKNNAAIAASLGAGDDDQPGS